LKADTDVRGGVDAPPRREEEAPPKTKLSVNLTDEAARVVRRMATKKGVSTSEIIRQSIALEKFVSEVVESGGTLLVSKDGGKTLERVHFLS
jgi:16S rRNA U516 pseudouridylate synthase RsuA-like enzyme